MEGKKISFGFKKTKKAEKPLAEESKEFIECMEEKSIKVVGGEQVKEVVPLVIPMKPNTLITAERLKQIADEVENAITEPDTSEKKASPVLHQAPPVNETLDQMVVRELLQGASKEAKMETSELTVPIPSKPVMEGQKESTLNDYEDVPIQEFGMAMLRGMGWTQSKEQSKYKHPQLRPKGLGLGADKVVTKNQKKNALNDKGEELNIVKNSFVKITSGKYNGFYGKTFVRVELNEQNRIKRLYYLIVVSLDEENGRAMVDITVKKETVSLSEFMMQAVTKSEFDKESKVINADSFDAYKKNEHKSDKQSHYDSKSNETKSREKEATSSSKSQDSYIKDKASEKSKGNHSSNRDYENSSERKSRDKYRRNSSSSEERSGKRNKDKKRHSSEDSLNSLSDSDKKRKHKSSRRRYSSSDSDSDSSKRDEKKRIKKRDIDKKRKGKKKKRDRDRSPHHYKKHRK